MENVQNLVIGVTGRKGSGKSYWTQNEIMAVWRTNPNRSIALFDPEEEMTHLVGKTENVIDPYSIGDFIDSSREQEEPKFIVDCVPASHVEWNANYFARRVFERKDMLVVFEEMAYYTRPQQKDDSICDLFRRGRKRNIDVVWTTQSISEVAVPARRATDIWVIFQHSDPRDFDALEERVGKETTEKVRALKMHEFLFYDVINSSIIKEFSLDTRKRSARSPEPQT